MPALKNPKHEEFAFQVAQGKPSIEAYKIAGYRPSDSAASRLYGDVRVKARVDELRARAAKDIQDRAAITTESLIAKGESIMRAASEAGQHAAAIAALKEIGVLSGKRIERREVGEPGEFAWLDKASELELIMYIETGNVPGNSTDGSQGGSV